MEQLGVSETPESSGEREANGLSWQLYSLEIGGVIRDVAVAESEGVAFIILLRSDASERDELYEVVFLPAVDALVLGILNFDLYIGKKADLRGFAPPYLPSSQRMLRKGGFYISNTVIRFL